MSLRHKVATPPLRALSPPLSPTYPPPAYVLEWSSQSRHRHPLGSTEEVRSEILAGACHGVERLLVVRGGADMKEVVKEMTTGSGETHAGPERRTSRKRRGSEWIVPERSGVGKSAGDVLLYRTSLSASTELPIMVIDCPRLHSQAPPPPLKHQDAATATNPTLLQASGQYGSLGVSLPTESTALMKFEDCLWDSLGGDMQVHDLVADVVREQWADVVDGLGPNDARGMLWGLMKALEQNLDITRSLSLRGQHAPSTLTSNDWDDLLARLHHRIQLLPTAPPPAPKDKDNSLATASSKDLNERSLDRIAYMGGLLLPITVVAGILSIEGRFGPNGTDFWVFWAASLGLSAIVIVVVYLDQLRWLEVWIEVAADAVLDEGTWPWENEDDAGSEDAVVKGGGRMWERRRLGWKGAMKHVCGYDWLRGGDGVKFQKPGDAKGNGGWTWRETI